MPDEYDKSDSHWLTSAIGDERDAKEIARAISLDPTFLEIVTKAVDFAEAAERRERDGGAGPVFMTVFANEVRNGILRGFKDPRGDVASDGG